MIFILFTVLVILTIIVYLYYKRDLLTPSIWLLFGYDASVLIALTQYNNWGDITGKTVIVISVGIIAFLFGGCFGNKVSMNFKRRVHSPYLISEICFSQLSLIISLIFLLIVTYLDFKYITNLALSYGYTGGTNIMTYARNSLEVGERIPYSLYIPIVIAQMLSYLITFDVIKGFIFGGVSRRHRVLKFLCVFVFLIIAILSSGRTMLMYYILYILFVACVMLNVKNDWSTENNRKIIKYGLISFVLILIAFTLIDTYLRSSIYGTQRTVWGQITKYTSSSVYALSNYLSNPTRSSNDNYETLYNLFSVLNRFGFKYEIGHNYLDGTTFANVTTNVYTALRRYIHDFGYLGMIFIQFFVGFFYQYTYKQIRRGSISLFGFIVYGTFIYAPVFNCIEERVLINVLSLQSLMFVVVLHIFIRLLGRKDVVEH